MKSRDKHNVILVLKLVFQFTLQGICIEEMDVQEKNIWLINIILKNVYTEDWTYTQKKVYIYCKFIRKSCSFKSTLDLQVLVIDSCWDIDFFQLIVLL